MDPHCVFLLASTLSGVGTLVVLGRLALSMIGKVLSETHLPLRRG